MGLLKERVIQEIRSEDMDEICKRIEMAATAFAK